MLIWGCTGFLDEAMQCYEMVAENAEQHSGGPFRREIGADFPEARSHRPAQGHTHRPSPLCPQKFRSYSLAFDNWQSLQPLSHRLAACCRSEKD
jgi:hypothetical protein